MEEEKIQETQQTQETQESKPEEEKEEKKTSEALKTIGKIILGVIFIILGIWAVIGWWKSVGTVFKGCIGLFLILAGAITIAIAKE